MAFWLKIRHVQRKIMLHMAFILRNVSVAEISSANVYKFNMGIHFLQLCKKVFKHLNPSKFYCTVIHNIKSFWFIVEQPIAAPILPRIFCQLLFYRLVFAHDKTPFALFTFTRYSSNYSFFASYSKVTRITI